MSDRQDDPIAPYDPPGAAISRFLVSTLLFLLELSITLLLLPLWILIPVPLGVRRFPRRASRWLIARTPLKVRDVLGQISKWVARAVEGRRGQLISGTTVTSLYYRYTAGVHVRACIGMLTAAGVLLGAVSLYKPSNATALTYLACFQVSLCVLLSVRIRLLSYRVNSGLFGTSPHEIREAIKFMVREMDDIDFSGGPGKRLPALTPESPPHTAVNEPLSQGARA
jgi:hypothetical protein